MEVNISPAKYGLTLKYKKKAEREKLSQTERKKLMEKAKKLSVDISYENYRIMNELIRSGAAKSKGKLINSALRATIGLSPEIQADLLPVISARRDLALQRIKQFLRQKEERTPEKIKELMKETNEKEYNPYGLDYFWYEHDIKIVQEYDELEKLLSYGSENTKGECLITKAL